MIASCSKALCVSFGSRTCTCLKISLEIRSLHQLMSTESWAIISVLQSILKARHLKSACFSSCEIRDSLLHSWTVFLCSAGNGIDLSNSFCPKDYFYFMSTLKRPFLGPRPHSKSTELTERPSLNNITTSWLNTKRCIGKDVDFEIIGLLQIGVPHLLLWYLKRWMV